MLQKHITRSSYTHQNNYQNRRKHSGNTEEVIQKLFRARANKRKDSQTSILKCIIYTPKAYFVLGMAPVPCMASTLRMARQTAFTEGVLPLMLTTSAHTSLMGIPSSLLKCHARAAAIGCKPRGCNVTWTVGMGPGGGKMEG